MTNQKKAYIYGFLAIFFWSTVASAFKIALRYNNPLPLLMGASFFSLLSLLTVALLQNKLSLFRSVKKGQLKNLLLLGVLNPFLYYMILFRAYDLLPAQIAQPLNYTWSIMLVLLSIIIQKQKLILNDAIAVIICYAGVVVISSPPGNKLGDINNTGVFLALATTVIWAFYWIASVQTKVEPLLKLIIGFLSGTLLILAACFLTHSFPALNWKSILSMLYVGLFEMGLTFIFWLKAMQLTEKTVKISNLIFLSPFASFLLIRFSLGEPIALTSVLGLLLIVIGIVFQHRFKRQKNVRKIS